MNREHRIPVPPVLICSCHLVPEKCPLEPSEREEKREPRFGLQTTKALKFCPAHKLASYPAALL